MIWNERSPCCYGDVSLSLCLWWHCTWLQIGRESKEGLVQTAVGDCEGITWQFPLKMTSIVSQMTSDKPVHALRQSESPLFESSTRGDISPSERCLLANMVWCFLEEIRGTEVMWRKKKKNTKRRQTNKQIILLSWWQHMKRRCNQYDILRIWSYNYSSDVTLTSFCLAFVWRLNSTPCVWCVLSLYCRWHLLYELEKCSIQLHLLLVLRWFRAHATPAYRLLPQF